MPRQVAPFEGRSLEVCLAWHTRFDELAQLFRDLHWSGCESSHRVARYLHVKPGSHRLASEVIAVAWSYRWIANYPFLEGSGPLLSIIPFLLDEVEVVVRVMIISAFTGASVFLRVDSAGKRHQ